MKRITTLSAAIDGFPTSFCSADSNGYPFQDCVIVAASICRDKDRCNAVLPTLVQQMAPTWQNLVSQCSGNNGRSKPCKDAGAALKNTMYESDEGPVVVIDDGFLKSLTANLWPRLNKVTIDQNGLRRE